MTEGSPRFVPPSDCGKDSDTGGRYSLWDAAKASHDPRHPAYAIFGGEVMGFKAVGNGLLVPTVRIMGIECPKVVGPGATNYWTPAWRHAQALNLPKGRVLVSVNSMFGRTKDQLHFHLTVLKKEVREQLDKLDPKSLDIRNWNSNLHILHATDKVTDDDSYVYRIAQVDNLDTNPFDLLNDHVATQKDSHGNPYNDRFDQSLAIVNATHSGYYLIATQYKPTQQGQPWHQPELDMREGGNHYYGTNTVEALIDRNWTPL